MGGGQDAAEQEGASASSEWAKLHAAPRAHVPRCQNLHGSRRTSGTRRPSRWRVAATVEGEGRRIVVVGLPEDALEWS